MIGLVLGAADPLNHVVQHPLLEPGGVTLLSNQLLMMFVAAGLLLYFIPRFVRMRHGASGDERYIPRGWGNLIESVCARRCGCTSPGPRSAGTPTSSCRSSGRRSSSC
jgi:hypothetical protein